MEDITIEIKVIDYDKLLDTGFLQSLKNLGVTTISFGSNSCYRQLPPLEKIGTILNNIKSFRKKFVVPILFESHFDKVAGFLDHFIDKIDCLCVNDLGILHYVSQKHSDKNIKISIGSGLFYSYEQCPWHKHILRDELEDVRMNILKGNYCNDWMIDILKAYHFQYEFEITSSKEIVENTSILRNEGFSINMEMGITPISFSRACHMARFCKKPVAQCDRVCLQMVKLSSTHRWDLFEGDINPHCSNSIKIG